MTTKRNTKARAERAATTAGRKARARSAPCGNVSTEGNLPSPNAVERTDVHLASHYRRGTEAHWYVSSAFNWRCDYSLAAALKALRAADKSAFPHMKELPAAAIYRVPGPLERPYDIRNYAPHGVDALFCGFDNLSTKGLD